MALTCNCWQDRRTENTESQVIWTGRWNQAVMLSLWGAVTVPLCLQYQIGVVLVSAGQTSAQSIMSVCWPQQSCDLVMWHVWYISVWVTDAAQCMVCIVIGDRWNWPQYIPLTLNLLFLKRNFNATKNFLGLYPTLSILIYVVWWCLWGVFGGLNLNPMCILHNVLCYRLGTSEGQP